jgi:hypothetical protein
MLDRLGAVRVCNDLRRGRGAVRMIDDLLAGRVARVRGLSRNLPLGDTGRELHKVVFLAGAVPLRNPARGERGRRVGGALGAGRHGTSHGE